MTEVNNRQYSETHRRCLSVLASSRGPHISSEDALFCLQSLPMPKNTRRISVLPPNQLFVHSQAAVSKQWKCKGRRSSDYLSIHSN